MAGGRKRPQRTSLTTQRPPTPGLLRADAFNIGCDQNVQNTNAQGVHLIQGDARDTKVHPEHPRRHCPSSSLQQRVRDRTRPWRFGPHRCFHNTSFVLECSDDIVKPRRGRVACAYRLEQKWRPVNVAGYISQVGPRAGVFSLLLLRPYLALQRADNETNYIFNISRRPRQTTAIMRLALRPLARLARPTIAYSR